MNLFRDDVVTMPAFVQYVRPQLELRDLLTRQQERLTRLENEVVSRPTVQVRERISAERTRGLTLRPPTAEETPKRRATFMNYLHFYPSRPEVRRSR